MAFAAKDGAVLKRSLAAKGIRQYVIVLGTPYDAGMAAFTVAAAAFPRSQLDLR
jgi:hypothetical protein